MKKLYELAGARIKLFREKKQLTVEELAHRAGLDSAHLTKMENGGLNFTIGSLEKVIKALDVPCPAFFQFEEDAVDPKNPLIDKTIYYMRALPLREQEHLYKAASILTYERRDHYE